MSNKNIPYAPKMRDFPPSEATDLKSHSPSGKTFTMLPNPITDPIVAQNISSQEFDYISNHETSEK